MVLPPLPTRLPYNFTSLRCVAFIEVGHWDNSLFLDFPNLRKEVFLAENRAFYSC